MLYAQKVLIWSNEYIVFRYLITITKSNTDLPLYRSQKVTYMYFADDCRYKQQTFRVIRQIKTLKSFKTHTVRVHLVSVNNFLSMTSQYVI